MKLGRLLISGIEEQCVFVYDSNGILFRDFIDDYDDTRFSGEVIEYIGNAGSAGKYLIISR